MAFNAQEFMADILKDVQVDESTKSVLSTIATNPVIAKRLEDGYLRQSDYSKLSQEYQTKIKTAQTYWDELAQWKKDEETRFAAERAKFDGTGSEGPKPADWEAKLTQLAQESVAYNNAITTIGLKHYKEFGEVLDTDELLKVAQRDRVNINIAHERLVQPKREEIQQTEVKKQIDAARKEGAEEAIKNFKIPVAEQSFNGSGMPHALDRFEKKDQASDQFGPMAAVKAYQQAMATGRHATE